MSRKPKPAARDDDQPSPASRVVLQTQHDRADAVADATDADAEADLAPTDDRPYPVGYGKPPVSTRFKPGQSGNPKGRKKGTKNFAQIINEVVSEKVTVNTERGRRKMPKLKALAISTLNQALQGDGKATDRLMKMLQAAGLTAPLPADADHIGAQELSAEDQAIVDHFIKRLPKP